MNYELNNFYLKNKINIHWKYSDNSKNNNDNNNNDDKNYVCIGSLNLDTLIRTSRLKNLFCILHFPYERCLNIVS